MPPPVSRRWKPPARRRTQTRYDVGHAEALPSLTAISGAPSPGLLALLLKCGCRMVAHAGSRGAAWTPGLPGSA